MTINHAAYLDAETLKLLREITLRPVVSWSTLERPAARLLTRNLAEVVNLSVGEPHGRVPHIRINQRGVEAMLWMLGASPSDGWQTMPSAPITGRVVEVDLLLPGGRLVRRAHWAHGDGDGLMPAFGPAWFIAAGPHAYVEVSGPAMFWRPAEIGIGSAT